MSYILHIDTSSDISTVSLAKNGVLVTEVTNTEFRNHAQSINNMITDSLADASVSISQLSAIAVCSGPGSYTGLRIAMATAKGICYASDLPLIATDKLTLLANSVTQNNEPAAGTSVVPVLIARAGEYFVAVYSSDGSCSVEPKHIYENELIDLLQETKNAHIISEIEPDYFYKLRVNFFAHTRDIRINHTFWAAHSQREYLCNKFVNLSHATPSYLKQVYTHK